MPRSGSGVYTVPPGAVVTTGTTISSSNHNTLVADLETDANTVRPIVAGGTGASTEDAALTNFGATATGKAVLTAASPAAARTAIGAELPAGAYGLFFMATAPSGWLKANGQAVSRTTYATLFAAIGTAYGAGDGSTTFNLPDMRGEFARAWDDSRGVDAGRACGFGPDRKGHQPNVGKDEDGRKHDGPHHRCPFLLCRSHCPGSFLSDPSCATYSARRLISRGLRRSDQDGITPARPAFSVFMTVALSCP